MHTFFVYSKLLCNYYLLHSTYVHTRGLYFTYVRQKVQN